MRGWVPVPGSAKALLVERALAAFEESGYDGVNVVALADEAGLTTGALYHHFGSKAGLWSFLRDEMETRCAERMEGAAAACGGGPEGARAALGVAFDAAVRFRAVRLLSEAPPEPREDAIAAALARTLPARARCAAGVLAAAWRGALAEVAAGARAERARRDLIWVLDGMR